MKKIRQVCVYCASSPHIREVFFDATARLARILAKEEITVVYGGGAVGLMGHLADNVLAYEGRVVGIIPDFMKAVELEHKSATEMHVVGGMHERKRRFLEGTDALITLPGGTGTFEELLEALTWKRLGLVDMPIVIVNTEGYYDPLLEMLNRAVDERFMRDSSLKMWTVVSEPEEVLPAILGMPVWREGLIQMKEKGQ